MTRWGLKARLTLWHAGATVAILLLASVAGNWVLTARVVDRLDAALLTLAETEAASALDSPEGVHIHELITLPATGGRQLNQLDKLVQIVDNDGVVAARSQNLGDSQLPAPASVVDRASRGETVIETTVVAEEPMRLVTLPIEVAGNYPYAIQVGTSLSPTYDFLRAARMLWLGLSLAILTAVIVIGALLARSALRPIDRVLGMAQRIGSSIRGRRLPHSGTDDEIGRLISTLNEMLDRLERSFEAHRRFTADAAHELRTPLSRIRSELEIALRRRRAPGEYEAAIRSSHDETVRLSFLTGALLTLARLDAGEAGEDLQVAPTDAERVLVAEAKRLQEPAACRDVRILLDPPPALSVRVPRSSLELLLGNLMENAVKFTPPGGRVELSARTLNGEVLLDVSDEGPGIPAAEVPKIFERFYRGDSSRSDRVPGFGLGLSICHAIAEAYGGGISVTPSPSGGSTFTIRLPLAD